jgi:polar amino acid transport system substrate-binding protein
MTRSLRLSAMLAVAAIAVAACSSAATTAPSAAPATPAPATAAPATAAPATAAPATSAPSVAPSESAAAWASPDANSLLGKIISSGKVRISTDPNYAPFSSLDTATGKYVGFDTSTAEEVVNRMNQILGTNLQIDWQTPSWDLITAGNWGGRWDMSIGSMSVTKGREKVVDFADPYYYDYGSIAVPTGSTIASVADLDGKSICVGASTTYEQWLKGTLEITDPNMAPPPKNTNITSMDTDNLCIQAVAAGRKFDAIVANEGDLANAVKQNQPITILQVPPPFVVSVAFALDKSGPNTAAMLALLNKIVADMHADGTLTKYSNQFLGKDVTQKPS